MLKSTTISNNDFLYELVLEIMTFLVLIAKKCVKPKIDLKGQYSETLKMDDRQRSAVDLHFYIIPLSTPIYCQSVSK